MSFRRAKNLRRMIAAAVAAGALAVPATSNAWSWGYNYMGSSVNSTVVAGWNYWSYAYSDKRSGDRVGHTWTTQAGSWAWEAIDGVTTYYSTPGQFGFGGYIHSKWDWVYGNSSYIYNEDN